MARLTFLPDVLEEHLDELGFLFGRWRTALRDPEETIRSVGDLEERIHAHRQGVLAVGERAHPLLSESLEGGDPDLTFAAAYAALHGGAEALTDRVMTIFESAEGPPFEAVATALAHAPTPPTAVERVRAALGGDRTDRAIAAAGVLAHHDALELSGDQLRWFLEDDAAAVRESAWSLAGDVRARVPARSYAAALRDDELAVTGAAMTAGAWCGERGTLEALRHLAAEPAAERLPLLLLLAALAPPDAVDEVGSLVARGDLGPGRFRLAGAFGHPALMDAVLGALEDDDPATAAAAGRAFTRMTGIDVESDEVATVPPDDGEEPDAVEAAFLDEVVLPDPEKARRAWDAARPRLEAAPRLCRGHDLTRRLSPDAFAGLDMESRREVYLRSSFWGGWTGAPLALERFPQARA